MQNISIDNGLDIIEGKFPVLFTAPHVHPHFRPDLRGVYKQGELKTDYIAKTLAEETNSFCLISNTEQNFDPNYFTEEKSTFKQVLRQIVDTYKVKFVVDIHGLNSAHPYDLSIFYQKRFLKSHKFAYMLAKRIQSGSLKDFIVQVYNFSDDERETIGEFVSSKLRIPAIQIEISMDIREDDVLLDKLIQEISKFVIEDTDFKL